MNRKSSHPTSTSSASSPSPKAPKPTRLTKSHRQILKDHAMTTTNALYQTHLADEVARGKLIDPIREFSEHAYRGLEDTAELFGRKLVVISEKHGSCYVHFAQGKQAYIPAELLKGAIVTDSHYGAPHIYIPEHYKAVSRAAERLSDLVNAFAAKANEARHSLTRLISDATTYEQVVAEWPEAASLACRITGHSPCAVILDDEDRKRIEELNDLRERLFRARLPKAAA